MEKKVIIIEIFDKLTGKTATLNPKSALVLSAITIIAADGVIDQER